MRELTQNVLQVAVLEIFNIFLLAEEVPVDVSPSEQPHVRVIGDGPVCVVGPVQSCALSLRLHRRNEERHAKEPQQLLAAEEHGQLTSGTFWNLLRCSAVGAQVIHPECCSLNSTNHLRRLLQSCSA